jgi:hypothetical protein
MKFSLAKRLVQIYRLADMTGSSLRVAWGISIVDAWGFNRLWLGVRRQFGLGQLRLDGNLFVARFALRSSVVGSEFWH